MIFGTYKLGYSGKFIIFCQGMLLASLFFPWLTFRDTISGKEVVYSAFSLYVGWIGYGIGIALIAISFFLLSHSTKERFRGYVPFRLSDAQAIVFLGAILAVALISFAISSYAYTQISSRQVIPGNGMKLAITAVFLLFIASYFYSQSEKIKTKNLGYIDKSEHNSLEEYKGILQGSSNKDIKEGKEKNMTLPI